MTDKVQSPCVDICLMDNGVCTACGMTVEESNKWYKMPEEDRRKVVERLKKAGRL